MILQPDQGIFFSAVAQLRRAAVAPGIGYRFVKQCTILLFRLHRICIRVLRPEGRKMADEIPEGGELFLASMGGKARAMSDQAMQA